jgi:putative oxidoreductase
LKIEARPVLRLVLRVLIGVVLLYAAYTKLRQSWLLFALSVDSYQILPEWAVLVVARTLPWFELGLGVILISGWQLRQAANAATWLLGIFFAVMVFSYVRGAAIDCGCFGVGEALGWKTLLRDAALVGSAFTLFVLSPPRRSG